MQHHYGTLTCENDEIKRLENGFDGSEDVMPSPCGNFFKVYQSSNDFAGDGQSDDSDADFDDMRTGHHAQPKMSRSEQKALGEELPWQAIMDRGPEVVAKFVRAAKDEEESWKQWFGLCLLPEPRRSLTLHNFDAVS